MNVCVYFTNGNTAMPCSIFFFQFFTVQRIVVMTKQGDDEKKDPCVISLHPIFFTSQGQKKNKK